MSTPLGSCSVVSGCAWELRRLTLGSGIVQQAICALARGLRAWPGPAVGLGPTETQPYAPFPKTQPAVWPTARLGVSTITLGVVRRDHSAGRSLTPARVTGSPTPTNRTIVGPPLRALKQSGSTKRPRRRGRPTQPHKCRTALRPPNRPSKETWNLNADSGASVLGLLFVISATRRVTAQRETVPESADEGARSAGPGRAA
jgi:hypothetical protein